MTYVEYALSWDGFSHTLGQQQLSQLRGWPPGYLDLILTLDARNMEDREG